jgi:peptidoglycan-associated lipoprotein
MKRILLLIAIASLVACSSKAVKDTHTGSSMDGTGSSGSQISDSGAQSNGMGNGSASGNPLTDPNNILSKRSVYFDFDKYNVKPEFNALIAAHGQYEKDHAGTKVSLEGNADSRGSREYNLALGQKRAVSVKNALNVKGASNEQLETVSYGKERADNNCKDDSCWQKDRRVDIKYAGE